MATKFLIIRFSSFGDIVQCMSVLDIIHQKYPAAEIHWITKSEFAPIVSMSGNVDKVWSYDKRTGLAGLVRMGFQLRKMDYEYIYDAHSTVRSFIISLITGAWFKKFALRKKERFKRFLLFFVGINLFPRPYKGMVSYIGPLKKWGVGRERKKGFSLDVSAELIEKVEQKVFDRIEDRGKTVVLVPSAAWEMKRWPLEHWKKLVLSLPGNNFIVLGGPADQFCNELQDLAPDRAFSFVGTLSLLESCMVILKSPMVISADTGLLHVADLFGIPGIGLIGPTAFGHTTGKSIGILEVPLKCRPCSKDGRGRCTQKVYRKCMVDISCQAVVDQLNVKTKVKTKGIYSIGQDKQN